MTTSIINSSDSGLDALTALYGVQLRDASHTLGLPDDYQISPSLDGDGVYGLGVVAADRHGNVTFDSDITRGSLDTIHTAAQTIANLAPAIAKALSDSRNPDREADEWHSRYEGVERPKLKLTHTPGWVCEDCSVSSAEVVHKLFSTAFEPLGLKFDVFENDGSPISIGMDGEGDWSIEGAGELLAIADRADELHRWLNDCAAVTAWCHDHDAIKETVK
jgi:hypothetical protein